MTEGASRRVPAISSEPDTVSGDAPRDTPGSG